MPKVTYDLSGVEDLPDDPHAPIGTYLGKIEAAEYKKSSNGNDMIEVRWVLTHDATGAKLKETFQPIWDYPILDHPSKFVMGKTKAFFEAVGLKLKGSLDPEKQLVNKKALLKLKSDTDQDGEYRPRIGKILPMGASTEAEPEESEAEPEGDGDGEAIDLDTLDRDALKKLIRAEKLGTLADLGINAKTTDDEIRQIIAEQLGGEPEAEPEEPEPEAEAEPEAEEEGVDLDALDRDALKKFIKEEALGSLADLGINKSTTDDQIRSIIAEAMGGEAEPEAEAEAEAEPEAEPESEGDAPTDDGYDAMSPADLKKEVKERELTMPTGAGLKAKLIKVLREDDGTSPF